MWEEIAEKTVKLFIIFEGADMAFITSGMGGGTGTGAYDSTNIRELVYNMYGNLPFKFEGPKDIIERLRELLK